MRNLVQRNSLLLLALLVVGSSAYAQNAAPAPATPARQTPPPEDINPGVDTSSPSQTPSSTNTPNASEATPVVTTPRADSPQNTPGNSATNATGSSATRSTGDSAASSSGTSAAQAQPAQGQSTSPAAQARAAQPGATPGGRGKAVDRLELDSTRVTGNRELPRVLYIVPWKRSDLGDLVGKPVNSLLDEVLTPVDRDVFQRENRYYRALTPGADEGASTGPEPKGAPQRAKPTNPLPAAGSLGSAEAASKQRSPGGSAAPATGNER